MIKTEFWNQGFWGQMSFQLIFQVLCYVFLIREQCFILYLIERACCLNTGSSREGGRPNSLDGLLGLGYWYWIIAATSNSLSQKHTIIKGVLLFSSVKVPKSSILQGKVKGKKSEMILRNSNLVLRSPFLGVSALALPTNTSYGHKFWNVFSQCKQITLYSCIVFLYCVPSCR